MLINPIRSSRSLWMSVIVPWDSRTSVFTLVVAFPCCKTSAAAWSQSFQALLRLRATSPSLSMSRMTFGLHSQTSHWRASYMPINLDCYNILILNKTLVCMEFISLSLKERICTLHALCCGLNKCIITCVEVGFSLDSVSTQETDLVRSRYILCSM